MNSSSGVARGQVGARALGRSFGGASACFLQSFKSKFYAEI